MTNKPWDLGKYMDAASRATLIEQYGVVSQVVGLIIESEGPGVELGEICHIHPKGTGPPIEAEVVGFRRKQIVLMPMGELYGVSPGVWLGQPVEPCGSKWGQIFGQGV